MSKQYENSSTLHEKILKGVDVLADNVASTLGPKGRNVILQQKGKPPIITKDGVTIAKFVSLDDPFENAGAQLVKQAASKTNDEAGDGTTTSTVLTRAILREAQKYLRTGVSPTELKRGMDKAAIAISEFLVSNSKQITSIDDLEHIATISANGDETIGKLVSTAIDQAGKDGAVSIEEARSTDTSLDLIEGFIFDSGYASPQFVTDERRGAAKYEDCLVFVTDYKLEALDDLLPLLEVVARENKPFLIVADDIEGQILAALIMNALRGSMKVAAVKAPRYGEERRGILSDLAIATGAKFITRKSGTQLRDVKLKDLGRAKTVEVLKGRTTVAGGKADYEQIEERISLLKDQIQNEESIQTCEKLQERITRLASGIAVIRVGAPTQVEMIEKKHRIEDALEAVNSAQLGGIHAGGGVPLARASKTVQPGDLSEEQKLGFEIVLRAIKEPIRQMAANAGLSPDLIADKVGDLEGNEGYDFAEEKVTDMLKAGIVDPVRVTTSALRNAISVASILLTTNYAIVETE